MRTVIHLSDLHFGRVDRAVVDAVRHTVHDLAPDLVAVSGDFTQRARARQFAEAREFLASLPSPQLIVPGNHDVPLHNVFARFFNPLGGYRRHMTDNLMPHFIDRELVVIGASSRVEIWDRQSWETYLADSEDAFAGIEEGVLPGGL